MSITDLRTAVTTAGGTPTRFDQVNLYRQLVTAWGGTPAAWTVPNLLRQLIALAGGTPTLWDQVGLLRQLVTARGGTPATYYPDALEAQLAALAMMSSPTPAFVAAGAIAGGTVGGGVANPIPYPAGLAANDILIFQVSYNDPNLTTDPAVTFSTPAGFAAMAGPVNVLGMDAYLFWKRASGSEAGTVSTTMTGGLSAGDRTIVAQITAWRGCKVSGDPFEALASNAKSDATMVGSSVITTGANRRVVALHSQQAFDRTLEGPLTSTPDTGWDGNAEQSFGTTTGYGTMVASSIEKLAAGTQAAESRTLSAARRTITHSFALMPV